MLERLRQGVEQGVQADDVDDEGDLRHHRQQGKLGGAADVGPLDVLALDVSKKGRTPVRETNKDTGKIQRNVGWGRGRGL